MTLAQAKALQGTFKQKHSHLSRYVTVNKTLNSTDSMNSCAFTPWPRFFGSSEKPTIRVSCAFREPGQEQ